MFGIPVAIPKAWIAARSTVEIRVYWVILRRPDSPSLRRAAKSLLITASNWMIIDAEIYGMIPNAKTEARSKAPPENMLNMPIMVPLCESKTRWSTSAFTPGTGIYEPSLNIIKAITTNKRRWRNSPEPLVCWFAISRLLSKSDFLAMQNLIRGL